MGTCIIALGFGLLFAAHLVVTNTTEPEYYVLVNGERASYGLVELYDNTSWYKMCDVGWDDNNAAVVCRMLGYLNAVATGLYGYQQTLLYASEFFPFKFDCTGAESSLQDCTKTPVDVATCTANAPSGVNCFIGNDGTCDKNLITGPHGVEDSAITASSTYPLTACRPKNVRMNISGSQAAWCPASRSSAEYLQVEFAERSLLKTLIIRGFSAYDEYIESFGLKISLDGNTWSDVRNQYGTAMVYTANTDHGSTVSIDVEQVIIAKYVRVHPQTWHRWPSMHLEIVGCPYERTSSSM